MPQYTTSPSYQNIFDQFRYRNLPLSVHHLPTEIVGIIFTMLDETWLQPSDTGMPPVLAVSRTCRQWRQISLSLPSLWSFLAIQFKGPDLLPDYRYTTLLTRLFTDRSRKQPLRLLIYFGNIVSLEGKEDTVIPILRTLVQHSERWHTIEFHSMTRAVMSHQLFSPLSGCLPMLTNLSLRVRDRAQDLNLDSSFEPFSNCPSLTRVSWLPGAGPFRTQNPLAWGQLRTVHLYFTEISGAFRMATLGTSIKQLALHYCSANSSGHLRLPSVAQLTIGAMQPDEAYCPFKCLTLQRLSSLYIVRAFKVDGMGEYWEDWNEKPIRDFFERSGCTVTSLILKGVPISDEQLIQLLRFMPALSILGIQEFLGDQDVITNRTVTRRFLQKLTIDDTSPPFLPKLTDIFLILHEDGLADTVLPNALISRWVPDGSRSEVACIKSVSIGFVKRGSEETIQGLFSKLQLLKGRGVQVAVGHVREQQRCANHQ